MLRDPEIMQVCIGPWASEPEGFRPNSTKRYYQFYLFMSVVRSDTWDFINLIH